MGLAGGPDESCGDDAEQKEAAMRESKPSAGASVDEDALFEAVRQKAQDPTTYTQPQLAERYPLLFSDLGLHGA